MMRLYAWKTKVKSRRLNLQLFIRLLSGGGIEAHGSAFVTRTPLAVFKPAFFAFTGVLLGADALYLSLPSTYLSTGAHRCVCGKTLVLPGQRLPFLLHLCQDHVPELCELREMVYFKPNKTNIKAQYTRPLSYRITVRVRAWAPKP